MPIDISDTINHLAQQRYRAIIINSAPEKSTELSGFLKKTAKKFNGKYFDLLNFFINSPEMSATLDCFSLEDFRSILIKERIGQSLIILDRADFLLDTWRKSDRRDFYRLLDNQWDGYKESMKATLIIGLLTSEETKATNIVDSQGENRVFPLTAFNDI